MCSGTPNCPQETIWYIGMVIIITLANFTHFCFKNGPKWSFFPYKSYWISLYIPFFKISWKNQKIYFLNVNYVIRQSQVIPIDVLWSGHPYWLTVSIFRISKCEILMIFWHSHANTPTKQKIIWSGVYQNYSEVSSNISAISWIFYEGLGPNSGSEIAF